MSLIGFISDLQNVSVEDPERVFLYVHKHDLGEVVKTACMSVRDHFGEIVPLTLKMAIGSDYEEYLVLDVTPEADDWGEDVVNDVYHEYEPLMNGKSGWFTINYQ